MSCGVGHRHGSDPELLWLWCRPVASAPIGPLTWEPLYAMGAALEKTKKIYIFLYIYISIYISLYMFIYISLYIFLSIYFYIYISLYI